MLPTKVGYRPKIWRELVHGVRARPKWYWNLKMGLKSGKYVETTVWKGNSWRNYIAIERWEQVAPCPWETSAWGCGAMSEAVEWLLATATHSTTGT